MVSVKLAASKTKEFKEFSDDIGKQLLELSPQIAGIYRSFQDKTKAIDLDIEFEHIYNLHQFLRGDDIAPHKLNKIRKMLQISAPLIRTIKISEPVTHTILYNGKWLESQYKEYRSKFASFVQEIACISNIIYPTYNIQVLFSMLSYFDSLHFKYTINKDPNPDTDSDTFLFGSSVENVFLHNDSYYYLYHDSPNCNGFIFDDMNAGGEFVGTEYRPWIYRTKI